MIKGIITDVSFKQDKLGIKEHPVVMDTGRVTITLQVNNLNETERILKAFMDRDCVEITITSENG